MFEDNWPGKSEVDVSQWVGQPTTTPRYTEGLDLLC